jgi:thiamine monophosphate kinase
MIRTEQEYLDFVKECQAVGRMNWVTQAGESYQVVFLVREDTIDSWGDAIEQTETFMASDKHSHSDVLKKWEEIHAEAIKNGTIKVEYVIYQ